jgi:hypothetical protein
MIEQAFYEHVSADAGISALISNRIYPFNIPHGVDADAVTYNLAGSDRTRTMGGESTYIRAIFDVDCWSNTYAGAIAIADAIEAALVDYRGQLGSTSPPVDADHIRLERRGPDQFEPDTELHRVVLQFLVGYEVG